MVQIQHYLDWLQMSRDKGVIEIVDTLVGMGGQVTFEQARLATLKVVSDNVRDENDKEGMKRARLILEVLGLVGEGEHATNADIIRETREQERLTKLTAKQLRDRERRLQSVPKMTIQDTLAAHGVTPDDLQGV